MTTCSENYCMKLPEIATALKESKYFIFVGGELEQFETMAGESSMVSHSYC